MKLHEARGMTPTQAAKVYIAGSDDDYLTTGIFAADCKFCKFEVNCPYQPLFQVPIVSLWHCICGGSELWKRVTNHDATNIEY